MSLEARIMEQLKQAMRDKNEAALRTLRAIKAAILLEKTASGAKEELTEAEELKMLQRSWLNNGKTRWRYSGRKTGKTSLK